MRGVHAQVKSPAHATQGPGGSGEGPRTGQSGLLAKLTSARAPVPVGQGRGATEERWPGMLELVERGGARTDAAAARRPGEARAAVATHRALAGVEDELVAHNMGWTGGGTAESGAEAEASLVEAGKVILRGQVR